MRSNNYSNLDADTQLDGFRLFAFAMSIVLFLIAGFIVLANVFYSTPQEQIQGGLNVSSDT